MNRISKKTVIVLVGILTISLVAGNALFAGSQSVVAADDVAIVSTGFVSDSGSGSSRGSRSSADIVTAEDIEFAAAPYNGTLVASGSSGGGSSQNVVNAADINFVRNGSGSDTTNLVCVVDGSQVSGKVCIN